MSLIEQDIFCSVTHQGNFISNCEDNLQQVKDNPTSSRPKDLVIQHVPNQDEWA